eukprot:4816082-Amphidinium_carterae.1
MKLSSFATKVKPNSSTSLGLIGNHFTHPRQLPAWITSAERPADMFCVSNRHLRQFVIFVTCSACIFSLAALVSIRRLQANHTNGPFAPARSAWHETCQQQGCFLVCTCAVLTLGFNIVPGLCTVVSDHMRFHFTAETSSNEACFMVVLYVWTCRAATRFYRRHATRMMMSQNDAPATAGSVAQWWNNDQYFRTFEAKVRQAQRSRWLFFFIFFVLSTPGAASWRVPSLWLFACVLTSAPG